MLLEKKFLNQYYQKANWIWLLFPLTCIYFFSINLRNLFYKTGLLKQRKLPIKTLVIGNRIVGGAGKTQLTIFLVNFFSKKGIRCGVVSRGYKGGYKNTQEVSLKSSASLVGDEPYLIKRKTGVPVVVGKSKYEAALYLLKKHNIDLLIFDDGLQNKSIKYDLSVLIEDDRIVTNNFLLPVGPYREMKFKNSSKNTLVISNSDNAVSNFIKFKFDKVVNLKSGKVVNIKKLKHLVLSIGIGNPYKLIAILKKITFFEAKIYEDHYSFCKSDFNDHCNYLLTEKDSVKCESFAQANMWVLIPKIDVCNKFLTKLEKRIVHG